MGLSKILYNMGKCYSLIEINTREKGPLIMGFDPMTMRLRDLIIYQLR